MKKNKSFVLITSLIIGVTTCAGVVVGFINPTNNSHKNRDDVLTHRQTENSDNKNKYKDSDGDNGWEKSKEDDSSEDRGKQNRGKRKKHKHKRHSRKQKIEEQQEAVVSWKDLWSQDDSNLYSMDVSKESTSDPEKDQT